MIFHNVGKLLSTVQLSAQAGILIGWIVRWDHFSNMIGWMADGLLEVVEKDAQNLLEILAMEFLPC